MEQLTLTDRVRTVGEMDGCQYTSKFSTGPWPYDETHTHSQEEQVLGESETEPRRCGSIDFPQRVVVLSATRPSSVVLDDISEADSSQQPRRRQTLGNKKSARCRCAIGSEPCFQAIYESMTHLYRAEDGLLSSRARSNWTDAL